MSMTTAQEKLDSALITWLDLLSGWSLDGSLATSAEHVLNLDGENAVEGADDLLQRYTSEWSLGDFESIPPIVLLSNDDISGARGAYATSTDSIYLNEDWLLTAKEEEILAVLTEELGAFLDDQLNTVDTQGDEGALFSAQLLGVALSDAETAAIQTEDDTIRIATPEGKTDAEASFTQVIAQFGGALSDTAWGVPTKDSTHLYIPISSNGEIFIIKTTAAGGEVNRWKIGASENSFSALFYDNGNIYAATPSGPDGNSVISKWSTDGELIWETQTATPLSVRFISVQGDILYTGGRVDTPGRFNTTQQAYIQSLNANDGGILQTRSYDNSLINGSANFVSAEISGGNLLVSGGPYGRIDRDWSVLTSLNLETLDINWSKRTSYQDWNSSGPSILFENSLLSVGYRADGSDRQDNRVIAYDLNGSGQLWDYAWGDGNSQLTTDIVAFRGDIYVATIDGQPWNTQSGNQRTDIYKLIFNRDLQAAPITHELVYSFDTSASDNGGKFIATDDALYYLLNSQGSPSEFVNQGDFDVFLVGLAGEFVGADPITGIFDAPGTVNLNNKGVTPFTLFGSDELNVEAIKVDSLVFGGKESGIGVAQKKNGSFFASYEDVNEDGELDLVVKVQTNAFAGVAPTEPFEVFGSLNDGTKVIFGLNEGDSINLI